MFPPHLLYIEMPRRYHLRIECISHLLYNLVLPPFQTINREHSEDTNLLELAIQFRLVEFLIWDLQFPHQAPKLPL